MRRACTYCGRSHKLGEVCPQKHAVTKQSTKTTRFRSSRTWRSKREYIARRDLYLCRVCLSEGRYSTNIHVHHIVPLAVDFSRRLDDDNLISLCSCHHEQAEAGKIPAERLRELAGHPPGVTTGIFEGHVDQRSP